MVDEAHSLGVLGKTGRGLFEHAGVAPGDVDIWMGTLSKTLVSCGGYVAGSRPLIDFLKYTAPGMVYSVGIPATATVAALTALDIMLAEPERVSALQANGLRFRDGLAAAGFDIGTSWGYAVTPAILGDSLQTVMLADRIPDTEGSGPATTRKMGEIAKVIVDGWSADLPDVTVVDRPRPARPLAPAVPLVEVSPLEARPDGPGMERVYRETDRKFWDLWKRAGGDPADARLTPMPNSWWEGNDPWKVEPVSALILHHTAQATDEECLELFRKPESFVSSHFLVGLDGRLWQFVSLEHRAWHAGTSLLHGRRTLNKTSIGVEITGNGNVGPFTKAQIDTTVRLVGVLTALFDLRAPWISGHENIAPDRKNDPGKLFPWNEVMRRGLELAERLKEG